MISYCDWAEVKARMAQFWNREELDRCCCSIRVTEKKAVSGKGHFYFDAKRADQEHRSLFAKQTYFGEAFPCIFPYFGTAGIAEYTGCKANRTPETVWFEPWMEEPDAEQITYLHPEAFDRQKDTIRELLELSRGEYPVSVTDNAGVMDALAAIRGTDNLLMDMITDPEFVEEALQKLLPIYKQTEEELFDLVKENNEGTVLSWMQLWAPGRMAQMQCDMSVMISPEMFNRFVMPELEELCDFLDVPVYHFDGQEQIRHLDSLLSLRKLRAIQWTPVEGQPLTSEFIPVLQKIQKAGKNLILFPKPHEVEKLLDHLSSTGLHLKIDGVQTVAEAEEVMELIEKHSKCR